MRRRDFVLGLPTTGAALASGLIGANSQEQPLMGYLDSAGQSSDLEPAWKSGLREVGYLEGKNLRIAYRWGENQTERLESLVKDLIDRNAKVILTVGNTAAVAAARVSQITPIVFMAGFDPVRAGIVRSLNQPGGNVTGVTISSATIMAKRLQLLFEIAPNADSIAVLIQRSNPIAKSLTEDLEAAAEALRVKLLVWAVNDQRDIEQALAEAKEIGAKALIVSAGRLFDDNREVIVQLASRQSLPSSYSGQSFVSAGGLMSYTEDRLEVARHAGIYVGKILKGENPSKLPVLQPTKFHFVINLKAAKELGLTVSPTILGQADEVIE